MSASGDGQPESAWGVYLITSSVKVCQPSLACALGSPALTVRLPQKTKTELHIHHTIRGRNQGRSVYVALSRRTPLSAHSVRHPWLGRFHPGIVRSSSLVTAPTSASATHHTRNRRREIDVRVDLLERGRNGYAPIHGEGQAMGLSLVEIGILAQDHHFDLKQISIRSDPVLSRKERRIPNLIERSVVECAVHMLRGRIHCAGSSLGLDGLLKRTEVRLWDYPCEAKPSSRGFFFGARDVTLPNSGARCRSQPDSVRNL